MKIVLAPDSFKGSADALAICAAIEEGVRRSFPDAEVVKLPMADGGEGTMDNLVFSTGGTYARTEAVDPLGRPIEARYGLLGDGKTAIVELAEASGLPRLTSGERDPLAATTYGTGQLIRRALDAGCREFIVGLGGSATNDGGAGMLQALGMKLLDEQGRELGRGGAELERIAAIDDSAFDSRVRESRFVIASDVRNPLCGPEGASAVFGPQKGATPAMVERLDRALQRFAEAIRRHTGNDVSELPGSGAAGGAGAALLGFFGATMASGAELVMQAMQFEERLRGADWVVTGEGRLDGQTASGKVVSRVSEAARAQGVPVIALCGGVDTRPQLAESLGLAGCFSLVPGPCELEDAMREAESWMRERAASLFGVIAAASGVRRA